MTYNYDFLLVSFVIYAILLFSAFVKRAVYNTRSRVYIYMLITGVAVSFFDMVSAFGIEHPDRIPLVMNYVLSSAYFIACLIEALLYFYYSIIAVNPHDSVIPKRVRLIVYIFGIIMSLLILTTPLTHLIFYFDETNNLSYQWGPLFILNSSFQYIVAAFGFVYSMINRAYLSQKQWMFSVAYLVIVILVGLIQLENRSILLTSFGTSAALWMLNMALDNFSYYVSFQNGSYSRDGYMEEAASLIDRHRRFDSILIYVHGLDLVKDQLTYENAIFSICSTLKKKLKIRKVFLLGESNLGIITSQKGKETAKAIRDVFEGYITIERRKLPVSMRTAVISYTDMEAASGEILPISDFVLESLKSARESEVVTADAQLIREMRERNHIITYMQDAVSNNKFSVYLQPILNLRTMQFETAEALIRLEDDDGKFISPEIFICLAEQNGLVFQIGEFVLREVCHFFRDTEIRALGVQSIHVNLSTMQCVQENLSRNLIRLMNEYQVSTSEICLEITETAAVSEDKVMLRNMQEMIAAGAHVALDDYGSGYAGTIVVMNYPFSVVKLDKYLVWPAMENERAWNALKYSVKMFKSNHIEMVAEGVETKEQADVLKKIGCDYLQGFYFSKPLDIDSYIEFLKKNQIQNQ